MESYKAEELFDGNGRLMPELAEPAPKGHRQMDADPHASLSEYSGSSLRESTRASSEQYDWMYRSETRPA